MILVDAGPLVALVDRADQHHARCVAALREVRGPLGTAWPVVAGAMYLLLDQPRGQDAIWEMLETGSLRLLPLDVADVGRIRELMARYRKRPMDFADAALVRIAERDAIDTVFTVDQRNFQVYRIGGRKPFRLLPQPATGRGRRRGSFLEPARDLAGSLKGGPADLSSNKQRLKGLDR